jgi:glucose/arabinose dehydrogenase
MSIWIELPGRRTAALLLVCLLAMVTAGGCIHSPQMIPVNRQRLIDRKLVEYPSNCVLTQIVTGLNCPTAICWDADGNMFIAESGIDGSEPHIFGYHKDHSYFNVYPWKRDISFFPTGFVLYGPVGGMAAYNGRLYVSHRDHDGKGVVTSLGMDGSHTTIVADLPAQGDYGVTDVVIHNGRVYFGIGSATNSGVVGLDNFDAWVKHHPEVHDEVYSPTDTAWKSYGYKFNTPNPWAGLFAPDIALTGPFQAFGHNTESRIRPSNKPNSAILSASADGGDCRVEAYGIRYPRGLAYGEYGHLYCTNDGMEMRGTRPIYGDVDSLLSVPQNAWLGFPDYTTSGNLVSDEKYRPPLTMLLPYGYPDISPLVDQDNSGKLQTPNFDLAVRGVFPSLSGAAKFDFVPASGPFKDLRGLALVALDGDRTPFASNGLKLVSRSGFKVVLVDVALDHKTVKDFVRNTSGTPASMQAWGTVALERPCDVKVGPDGAIYILDFGQMENDSAIPRYHNGTGSLFKLEAIPQPAATDNAQK